MIGAATASRITTRDPEQAEERKRIAADDVSSVPPAAPDHRFRRDFIVG